MSIFNKKTPPTLGLDISSTAVKLILLSRSESGVKVENFAVEPLPVGAVKDKVVVDTEAVSTAIARAVRRSGAKTKYCAVAVSGSSVMTKTISLPSDLTDVELESQIEIEADQYIPYALDEVRRDFEVLGPSRRSADLVDVLLAACKTETVDMLIAAVEDSGLKVRVIDVEAYAIANAFELIRHQDGISTDKTIAVVEVGAQQMGFIVLQGDRVIYSREHAFGANQLLEDISRRYELSPEEALVMLRGDDQPDDFQQMVIEPFQHGVVQQIGRALQFYSSSNDFKTVETLFLAAGGAQITGLEQVISDELGISTEIADPVRGLALANNVAANSLRTSAPSMMTACGLAMRGFD
ncbi:MAG: pilus assembly protein PilM [Xanthomonadales bacterium]|nr:pilus assembly protein PilM [Xanthomonadales bacterium]